MALSEPDGDIKRFHTSCSKMQIFDTCKKIQKEYVMMKKPDVKNHDLSSTDLSEFIIFEIYKQTCQEIRSLCDSF